MQQKFYVYNEIRQSFLSLGVSVADTHLTSLKGLIGKRRLGASEGLWMVPSQGIHTVGVLFPIDVIYLDTNGRVIELVEHLPPFRIAPIRLGCASVLELPIRSIYSSQTQLGDTLSIGSHGQHEENHGANMQGWREFLGLGRRLRQVRTSVAACLASFRDRRVSKRVSLPLQAHYWNGGTPRAYQVKNVSPMDAYIVTPDRWYPGTLLLLTFQYDTGRADAPPGLDPQTTVTLGAKLARIGPDGVGVSFLHANHGERLDFEKFLDCARARRA
jgi:uncharacterized membrane protein (UPF0127 family)